MPQTHKRSRETITHLRIQASIEDARKGLFWGSRGVRGWGPTTDKEIRAYKRKQRAIARANGYVPHPDIGGPRNPKSIYLAENKRLSASKQRKKQPPKPKP